MKGTRCVSKERCRRRDRRERVDSRATPVDPRNPRYGLSCFPWLSIGGMGPAPFTRPLGPPEEATSDMRRGWAGLFEW